MMTMNGRTSRARLAATAVAIALVATGAGGPGAQALTPGELALERDIGTASLAGTVSPVIDQATGDVVVADTSGNRVVKFDPSGNILLTIGGGDQQPALLNNPYAVAVDGQSNIYVADTYHHLIRKFSSTGQLLKTWGGKGIGDGSFEQPRGVAVDQSGKVYVADTGNDRIQKFDGDGNWLDTWGTAGNGNGQFDAPKGITITPNGDLAVADGHNYRVQILKTSAGTFLKKWGSLGSGPGQFSWGLDGIAVDAENRFYVTDAGNERVQIFTADGEPLGVMPFGSPDGVAVHLKSGHLYVGGQATLPGANLVRVYRPASVATFTAGPKTSATAGKAYSSLLAGSGFPAVSGFAVAAGSLPHGLKLTGSKIAGYPTKPGTYPMLLRADNGVTPNAWKAYTIWVGKASAKVTAKLSTKRPKAGATRIKARIRVSAPYTTGLGKTGKVRVSYGKKRVKTITVKRTNGTVTVRLPKFTKKGKTKVTLRYLGNTQLKTAKRTVSVRVR